ncbi:MAG TPA: T9SS type A sorting domain-containing protein [Bacteroidia bacterium]|nr:T9SS type A sorting domain-containing protein [Bacteroidia bacterium]
MVFILLLFQTTSKYLVQKKSWYNTKAPWGLQYMVSSHLPSLTAATGYEHAKTMALATAALNGGDFSTALSLTNSFAPNDTLETNWQSVTNIMIKLQSDTANVNDTISAADINTLQSVAAQCPHAGGLIVWNARSILTNHFNAPQVYPNDCPTLGDGERVQNTTNITKVIGNNNQLSLYPNPSTGKLYISNFDANQKTASIEITDITGKLIAKQQSNISNSLVELNLDVNNGVYFVKVVADSGKQQVQKLIISK